MSLEDIDSPSQEPVSHEPPGTSLNTLSEEPISWSFRISRAESLGQSDRDKLLGLPSCAYSAKDLSIRNRIVVVRGRDCSHTGFTDRKSVASSHCNLVEVSSDPRLIPSPLCIFQSFPSLKEARVYWHQIFPGTSLDPLPVTCDHISQEPEEWHLL